MAVQYSVESLFWATNTGKMILKDISFSVFQGERLAVIGPNGAGKSSLLRCLQGLYLPQTGQILLDGQLLHKYGINALSRKIAAVHQEDIAIPGLTVRDIVALGRLPYRANLWDKAYWQRRKTQNQEREIIADAIAQMALTAFRDRLYETLSGGERKRVMIARALAQQPDILILDEPINHLDIYHQFEVIHLLQKLPQTIICCLHDLNHAAALQGRVAIMSDGCLQAIGPIDKVLTPGLIESCFGVRAKALAVPDQQTYFHLSRVAVA